MHGRPPSVEYLAREFAWTGLPHTVLVDVARDALALAAKTGEPELIGQRAEAAALGAAHRLLQPVVNATGVLLHTNLGRAPLAIDRAARYSNLEFDLVAGSRGHRSANAAALLARACGAEAALVVNKGVAAILLVLSVLANGSEVANS